MILVYGLGPVHRAEETRQVELCHSNQELKDEQDVYGQSKPSMNTLKSRFGMRSFVHFDDDQPCEQEAQRDEVEPRVDVCPLDLLLLCRCGLQEEDRLDKDEYAGRVEKLHHLVSTSRFHLPEWGGNTGW